jgi:putative component of toxin-antitoxin plasmid stabilization module
MMRLKPGNTSSVKWLDGIGEYVVDWGPGYRAARHASPNKKPAEQ